MKNVTQGLRSLENYQIIYTGRHNPKLSDYLEIINH